MIQLNEEKKETKAILEEWRKESRNMTLEKLPKFLDKIMNIPMIMVLFVMLFQ